MHVCGLRFSKFDWQKSFGRRREYWTVWLWRPLLLRFEKFEAVTKGSSLLMFELLSCRSLSPAVEMSTFLGIATSSIRFWIVWEVEELLVTWKQTNGTNPRANHQTNRTNHRAISPNEQDHHHTFRYAFAECEHFEEDLHTYVDESSQRRKSGCAKYQHNSSWSNCCVVVTVVLKAANLLRWLCTTTYKQMSSILCRDIEILLMKNN